MSLVPSRHAPFVCVSCAREIPAKAWHIVLTPHSSLCRGAVTPSEREASAGAMVCARCRDLPSAHQRLFPQCEAPGYCDLYDHGHTLAADRTAAVTWLTQHGRISDAPAIDATTEGEQS